MTISHDLLRLKLTESLAADPPALTRRSEQVFEVSGQEIMEALARNRAAGDTNNEARTILVARHRRPGNDGGNLTACRSRSRYGDVFHPACFPFVVITSGDPRLAQTNWRCRVVPSRFYVLHIDEINKIRSARPGTNHFQDYLQDHFHLYRHLKEAP